MGADDDAAVAIFGAAHDHLLGDRESATFFAGDLVFYLNPATLDVLIDVLWL